MASWDEHVELQTGLNIILGFITSNPFLFFILGYLQHLIVDNLINKRPVNIFSDKRNYETNSLLLNIVVVIFGFILANTVGAVFGLLGCLLPDILEGIRLVISSNGKDVWMKGNSEKFHLNLPINYLIDTKWDYQNDMFRRIILFCVFTMGVSIWL